MASPPLQARGAGNPAAGSKRPAPTLGAPFEPELGFSPPKLSKKRQVHRLSASQQDAHLRYPSPIPTSSAGLPSSPPPHPTSPFIPRRPATLHRSHSTLSERAPLGALPELLVPGSGEAILLGRSSNSSHYQLSFNRHVSRTHVKLEYVLTAMRPTLLVECLGANGAKIHCDGQAFDLRQGDKFTTSAVDADIILDIMDSRVLVKWPRCAREASAATTAALPSAASSWDDNDERDSVSPRPTFVGKDLSKEFSPPVSPTPRPRGNAPIVRGQQSMNDSVVTVYEDGSDEEDAPDLPALPPPKESRKGKAKETENSSSELSELDLESDDENDHASKVNFSFAPNSDLPPMAELPANRGPSRKPEKSRQRPPLKSSPPPVAESRDSSLSPHKSRALINHLSNQLAFARVSVTPLSDLLHNLPPSITEHQEVTREKLISMLLSIPWIGEVRRTGKDAAGRPLESEFYYILEKDTDVERKSAVEGLRKPGLRSCRKVHKQYYWRKPKLP